MNEDELYDDATTWPTARIKLGFAQLLAGIETDAFDNGTPEPWRSLGQRLQAVGVGERAELLKSALTGNLGIDWSEFSRDLASIDPNAEVPIEEETPGDGPAVLPAVPPFPLDALPDAIREYVCEGADMIGCPPDYIAVSLMASASAAIGTAVRLQIKEGWYEWPSLYTAVVAPSASKKTPAMSYALRFARDRDLQFHQAHISNLETYEREMAEFNLAKHERHRSKDISEPATRPDKPKRPIHKRVTIADATVEAIGKRLHENHRGLLLVRDEIASLLLGMNQYRSGRGNDEQFFLSVWSSDYTTIDRKQDDDPVVLHQPFLSICGGIQPGILPKILGKDRLEDGFTARLLFAYPDALLSGSSDATVSEVTIERTRRVFEALFLISPKQPYLTPPEPHVVRMTPEARALFREWEDAIQQRVSGMCEDDPFRAPLAKMPGYLARIALIIHVVKWTNRATETIDDLDRQTVSEAIALADYFVAHATRVWHRLVESPENTVMRRLQNWLAKRGRPVSVRQIQRAGVAGFQKSQEVLMTLQRMEELGFVTHRKIGRVDWYSLTATAKEAS